MIEIFLAPVVLPSNYHCASNPTESDGLRDKVDEDNHAAPSWKMGVVNEPSIMAHGVTTKAIGLALPLRPTRYARKT